MHERSSHVELKVWQSLKDWQVSELTDNLFAARIGYAVTEPRVKVAYEDDNVKLSLFQTEAKAVLGYTLFVKEPFNVVKREWYVSLINPKVDKHHSPEVAYNDSQVFLRKFNNLTDPSYWMILRWRTT